MTINTAKPSAQVFFPTSKAILRNIIVKVVFPMKAVILAGGEGSRLRPLTLGRPKPMTPLFGKPVLGHILDLLRRHGIREAAVTLGYLPAAVTDFFGDGSQLGMKLTYFVEKEPLGTAGGVKKCMDYLGEEDFLVLSGDGVCDLDLGQFMALHQSRRSAASLALARRQEPLEYGLVRTDSSGRVLGFVEKPGWGEVDTELVNTGVYLLSHRAMELVPDDGEYDFGKELFPRLLERGEALYGWEIPGYWQDMGDCGAYLDCAADALAGKVALDLEEGQGPIPEGVEIRKPCWIGRRTFLARGCTVGPYAVIGEGSTVETGAVVERSVLLGASVGEGAEVTGAILCQNAAVHSRAMVGPGAVLGEGATVGAEAIVAPGVKLWPGRRVAEGGKATASQVTAGQPASLRFSAGGALQGTVGEELTPETMVALGSLLGEKGQVALGWAGGAAAGMLGRALGCGVAAAGGQALVSDAPCPSAAAWLGRYYRLPVSLFVQQDGDIAQVRLFGGDGLSIDRPWQRKLEGALLRGESSRVPAGRVGRLETVAGVRSGYGEDAARRCRLSQLPLHPIEVWVERGEGANAMLASALVALGCKVYRGMGRGIPAFSADWGGFRLTAWDEEGNRLSPDQLLVLLTRIEMENGTGRAVAPAWAPTAAETVALSFGGSLLRLGRDGEAARQLWREQPWMWDAVFAACRICARMGLTGQTLSHLGRSIPRFATVRGEVSLRSGRGRVMGRILEGSEEASTPGEGARLQIGDGWVYLAPMSSRSALRIIAEASDMETAQELCGIFRDRAKRIDGEK